MILLFPGSFKPFHDGHFSLLKRYIEELSPEKVYIIISSKKRAGIPASVSKKFIKKVFGKSWDNIEFIIKVTPKKINPINYCYKIIGNDKEKNQYVMINSDKDSDTRVEDFYELFKKGGEYYHNKSYAVDPEIETDAIYYSDRNDEYADSPISSAIVRNDIINDDFDSFKLSYNNILEETYISLEDLEDYFEDLSDDIEQTDDDIDKLTRYLKESVLNEVLIEWNESSKQDSDNVFLKSEDIKKSLEKKYFIYRLDEKDQIKIFDDGTDNGWPEFEKYKDKVWINDKHVKLDNEGWTVNEFKPGEYKIYIKDINKVTDMTYMFWDCNILVAAFIPNSITSIGEGTFSGCTGLTSVTIHNSVTEIGDYAFCNCSNLTSINIPNSVMEIDDWSFYGCSHLTSVTIPNSVTKIGGSAFLNCNNLKTVYVEDINKFNQIKFNNKWSDPRYYGAKVIELKK